MSNNRIRYEGLEELKANLRNLPEHLRDKGREIVVDAGQAAHAEIRQQYEQHRRSGDLLETLEIVETSAAGGFFAGVIIRVKSHKASWFENGTEVRETKGFGLRGRARPANIFVPTVMKHRRDMREKLKALVRSQGLRVTGG